MKKNVEKKNFKNKVIILAVAIALVIGAGIFTTITLIADAEDINAKETKIKTATVADEKNEKEAVDKDKDAKAEDDKDSKTASEEKTDGNKSVGNKSSANSSGNKSSNSSGNKNSGSSSSGGSSSSSSGGSSSSTPSHSHSWQPVTATRQVVTGYEYKAVGSIEVCVCGARGIDYEHTKAHLFEGQPSNTAVEYVYDNVPIYGSETYVDHYKCSCGATQ